MEAIVSTFHIDWQLLIAQAINFGVVAVVLWWFGFKPLAQMLSGRAEKIEQGLADAASAGERLKQAEVEAKEIIVKARSESQSALAAAAAAAERLRADELIKAKAEVEKAVNAGKSALVAEKAEMLKELKAEAADLVVEATKSLLKNSSLPEVNKSLASKAIAELK